MTERIYAIDQPSTMEGINEEECNEIINCKIVSENVLKYPDRLDPFANNEDISNIISNNLNDLQKMAEKPCQKMMDVDIVRTDNQLIGEQMPKYLICLP